MILSISSGRRDQAMAVLKKELTKHPNGRDILVALITFSHEAGDINGAFAYATRLERIAPDPEVARLIEELRRQATKTDPRGAGLVK